MMGTVDAVAAAPFLHNIQATRTARHSWSSVGLAALSGKRRTASSKTRAHRYERLECGCQALVGHCDASLRAVATAWFYAAYLMSTYSNLSSRICEEAMERVV
jgi:hypothetical protein